MKITRNYDEYEESSGSGVMPAGTYMFEIAEKEDKTSQGGDVMINITLRCIEPEHSGSLVWDRILLPLPESPAHKVIGRSKRFLHAIGEPFQGNFGVDTDRWLNKVVEAKISQETYNNKLKNVVDRYNVREDTNKNSANNNNNAHINKPVKDHSPFITKDDDFPF